MPLPSPKGHRISLQEAIAHIQRAQGHATKGGLFLRKELDDLLAQPGCSGLRFYYGQDSKGAESLILVGVDQDGKDMTDGVMMDVHFPCPPFCNDDSLLTS